MPNITPNYGFVLPDVGGSFAVWGYYLNAFISNVDSLLKSLSSIYTGPWSATVGYTAGQIALYNGVPWFALQPSTNVPPVAGAYWMTLVGPKGDTGSVGTPISEVPQGIVNGSNKTFTISKPAQFSTVSLNYPLVPGIGYTLTGTSLTYAQAPELGDTIFIQGF